MRKAGFDRGSAALDADVLALGYGGRETERKTTHIRPLGVFHSLSRFDSFREEFMLTAVLRYIFKCY